MTFPAVTRHAADLVRELLAKTGSHDGAAPLPVSIEVSPIGWAKIRRQADKDRRTAALAKDLRQPAERSLMGLTVVLNPALPAACFETVFADGRRERFPL